MDDEKYLGVARCRICGGEARVSFSKKNLAVVTCPGVVPGKLCSQLFTRGDAADEIVRGWLVPDKKPSSDKPVAPLVDEVPEVLAVTPKTAKPAEKGGGWDKVYS